MGLFKILTLLVSSSLGDICEDFCFSQLGEADCQQGSWCKNGHACHALFWTSEERVAICVFTETGDCADAIPVLCEEVRSRPSTQSAPVIDFIRTRRAIADDRPFVRVEYEIQGRGMAFVALFDTSTDRSLVPITGQLSMAAAYASAMDPPAFDASDSLRVRPCRTHQRYIDSNRALLINAGLEFDFEGMITESCRVVRERATLHSVLGSTYSFDIDVALTLGPQPFHFMLAAGKGSDFTRAAGVFAMSGSQLIVGDAAAEYASRSLCENSLIQWSTSESDRWTLPGSVTSGAMSRVPVQYVINTRAKSGFSVPLDIFDFVVNSLVARGAEAVTVGSEMTFNQCDPDFSQLPIIRYSLGSPPILQLSVDPRTYLQIGEGSTCKLELYTEDDNITTLGANLLSMIVAVLDGPRNRVGLCFPH